MKTIKTLLLRAALGVVLSPIALAADARKCLLIGAPEGAENAEFDVYIIPRLKAWGYVVETRSSADLPKLTAADYAPYDFIFLSETTHSSQMSPLRDIPKPMVCSDGWAVKESALAFAKGESSGILEPSQPIVFLEGAKNHPLAAGYAPGTVVELAKVENEKQPALLVWGHPSIPVVAIAGVESDPAKLAIFGIERGTTNVTGGKIPHRVAVIGTHAWGYDDLTESGEKLFKAAIEWVVQE
jgi:hypothetical protein